MLYQKCLPAGLGNKLRKVPNRQEKTEREMKIGEKIENRSTNSNNNSFRKRGLKKKRRRRRRKRRQK